ncbi:hypothetical protein [Fibrobacter sp.]|uniref:hypothetical protein n=1 Tax=Fibrobacter sp. TaxID=35828 RepID=UPI0025BF7B4F|nr:hypothetical protein [Fibrobacter sp.]MBR3070515.1 hypothetical protein [Fibrobacter sp.]
MFWRWERIKIWKNYRKHCRIFLKIDEERVKLREERASLANPGDTVKKFAEESFELFAKCKNQQLDEGECKKREKLLSEREKKLSVSDQEKLQAFVMQKLIEK